MKTVYVLLTIAALTCGGCQSIKTRSHDRTYDPTTGAITKDEGLEMTYSNTTAFWDAAKASAPAIGNVLSLLMPGSSQLITLLLGVIGGGTAAAPVGYAVRARQHRAADAAWDQAKLERTN